MNALRSASPFPWTNLPLNRGDVGVATPAGAVGWAWTMLDRVSQGAAFSITAAMVAVAMLITLLADPRGDGPPRSAPLTGAVALSALGFGWRAGLFANALGTLLTVAAWLSPFPQTALHRDPVGLLLFVAGGVVVTIATQLFVTARRQAQHVQKRLRSVIDSAPALIWMADPGGRVTWVNRAWLAFTSSDEADTFEPHWLERVHPDDREACRDAYRHGLEAREAFEHRLQRRDGEHRWVVNRGVPVLNDDGRFTGMVGSCIDVHERREAARERERLLASERSARQDAERASRTNEEFLSIVSHELRAPLNAIVGWAYVLREQSGNTGEGSRAAAVIERNSRAQSRLVDDLIDMSRLLSGRLRFERTPVDLGQVARRAVEAMQPAAAEDLAVSIDLPEPSPRVLGDPRRLEQALQNLLSNAMKFTPAGGRVSLVMRSDGRTATITVEDTGHGIPSEFLPHVFDRFRQADASSTRRYGGLGIGLSLVRGIVEHHGGTVGAASEGLGRGSCFTISLPLSSPPPERIGAMSRATRRPSGAGSRLAGLRVMVVDDDEDTCELLRRLLQQFGAEVRTSTSVTDALAAWEVERPDVLVSDISMPEQDGYALVRQIRRKSVESGGSVPAIALTALARSEDQRTALDAGFQMHLRKPVEPFDLVDAIHSLATRGPAHA